MSTQKNTANVTAELGTVISGTMRPEDLIPAFMNTLDSLKEKLALSAADPANRGQEPNISQRVGAIDDFLARIEQHQESEGYHESDEADEDLEELIDRLSEFAPPGCYFGGHPGDGADYGFWQSEDEDRVHCDQCEMLSINGVACHEQGCPNAGKVFEDGEWVKYLECGECGCDVREGESCDCMEPAERQSLTYGELPTREEFDAAFARECPDGSYHITLGRSDAEACEGLMLGDGEWTADQLWLAISEITESSKVGDAAMDLVSSILETLGFEWV